jgi:(3S)-linalool synthase
MEHQEGVKSVKAMLHQNQKDKREVVANIDHLKRLCIDHYFQDEIDEAMTTCLDLVHSDDLLDATLSLRLVREAGYDVSAGWYTYHTFNLVKALTNTNNFVLPWFKIFDR